MFVKPLLGGVLLAQRYLQERGFSLPVFIMGIQGPWHDDIGRTPVPIEEVVRTCGPMHRVRDFLLTSGAPEETIRCIAAEKAIPALPDEDTEVFGTLIQVHPNSTALWHFLQTAEGDEVLNLLLWGKARPSLLDKAVCLLFPRVYAQLNRLHA